MYKQVDRLTPHEAVEPKGGTLPTVKWQASREGVCWVGCGKDLLGWGNGETHRENDIRGQACPRVLGTCETKVWKYPARHATKQMSKPILAPYWPT